MSFYALCDPTRRLDALVATLSTFAHPGQKCDVRIWVKSSDTHLNRVSVEEAIAAVRAAYGNRADITVSFFAELSSGREVHFGFRSQDAEYERSSPPAVEPFSAWVQSVGDPRDEPLLEIAIRDRSIGAEAAIKAIWVQQEVEEIMRVFCLPDAQTRVTACGDSTFMHWGAPVEGHASYYTDGNVARDLALTWVHVHDGDRMRYAAGLSLDELRERVEAAPVGSRIGIALSLPHIEEHLVADQKEEHSRPKRRDVVRSGPRTRLPGDVDLTREQVLAALSTPPATLLEALEAAAVPDDEWRAAEPLALELIAATKKGAPTHEVNVATGRHVRFIEQHAPYHVRRLPNGGVMLATHPYRILWPLWADALSLLRITR